MTNWGSSIPDWDRPLDDALPANLSRHAKPTVLKGLATDWPLVQAATKSDQALCNYLVQFDRGEPVKVMVGDPCIKGRFFYQGNSTEFNFQRQRGRLSAVLARLQTCRDEPSPPAIAVQSAPIPEVLPGLEQANSIQSLGAVVPRIWLGNRIRVAAHYDPQENIACVAAGRRRFTLFPPEQLPNLYVGPLDVTPAGAAISMVDFANPDFERHPKFRLAMESAWVAELDPGDALYIPPLWWHHVESLDAINVLVNYWWDRDPAKPHHISSPADTLLHALLSLRDLPSEQRHAWKSFFDYYVFLQHDDPSAHLDEAQRGVLGPVTDVMSRQIHRRLLEKHKLALQMPGRKSRPGKQT